MSTTLTAPAASSPAPETTVFTPDSGEARAEFFKTGKMPEPTKADPSTAKESSAEGVKPKENTAPASEAGTTQEPKHRSNADSRLNELLDDLREAGLTPKALKSFKQDYQRTQQQAEASKPETKAEPVGDSKAPVKPKPEDFEGKPWTEYEAAKDKYFEDLADYKAAKAIEDDRTARQQETASKELQTKLEDAKSRYGDTAEETIRETSNTIFNDAKIAGVVKALVNDSPVLVDLLYVIGSKAEDMADFVKTAQGNPGAAIRKLVLIEKLVMEELAKGGKSESDTARGEDGKFKAPEKKTTAAPPPPKEVGATGAPPPDEVEAAIKRGDDRAAIDAMNRADIRRRKGH